MLKKFILFFSVLVLSALACYSPQDLFSQATKEPFAKSNVNSIQIKPESGSPGQEFVISVQYNLGNDSRGDDHQMFCRYPNPFGDQVGSGNDMHGRNISDTRTFTLTVNQPGQYLVECWIDMSGDHVTQAFKVESPGVPATPTQPAAARKPSSISCRIINPGCYPDGNIRKIEVIALLPNLNNFYFSISFL